MADIDCIPADRLREHFQSFGKGLAVTSGIYELRARHEARDLAWNHMDQMHRPLVHNTYNEASRVARGRNFALSINKMTPFSLLVPVMDVQVSPSLYYQSFTLFSLVHVLCVNRMIPEAGGVTLQRTEWHITSHKAFKFLHPLVDRRFRRLVQFQNAQDIPIRDRRAELRSRGYRFASDEPDYLNSNSMALGVRPPALEGEHRVPMPAPGSALTAARAGAVELLLKPEGPGLRVWPGVCPHEGGPLSCGRLDGERIECPWHNLSFPGLLLTKDSPTGPLAGLELTLQDGWLLVRQGR